MPRCLGCVTVACLFLKESAKLFFKVPATFTFLTAMGWWPSSLASSPAFGVVAIFYSSHSDRYIHIWLNWHFLNRLRLNIWKRCLLISFVFLNWIVCYLLLNFESFLYSLDTNPLSDTFFATIFSNSVAYVCILLTQSFTEQTLRFWWSNLLIIPFKDHAFHV